ncbi:uncharacterized protein LOC125861549 [Solanum stenotomum]|uniref:uncharacterized protein LOC125861549 n=1 Tax=Solanum stenotomum TaxID=172797 RepID=UPI0020D0AC63|nr:uncharacterized protein LOC125861549 [Solanum stenotomum]
MAPESNSTDLPQNGSAAFISQTSSSVQGQELWGHWERVNAIVLSWLLYSVSKSLLSDLAFASSVFDVWIDLRERFDRVDGSRTYSLYKDISSIQQSTAFVYEYYTRLKTLWDEFEILVPSPCCNCEISKFVTHMNRQKVYQFLMGLNESYRQARSQILMLDPLPTINHVYSMIVRDECQKVVVTCATSLGMASISLDSFVAMYSKAGSSSGVGSSSVGYPPDFKSKRKVQGGSSPQASSPSSHYPSAYANFTYGLNTNIPPPGWGISLNQQQLMNGHAPEVSSTITPNRISQVEREYFRCNKSYGLYLGHDAEDSVSKLAEVKPVYLPNGTTTQVSHVGSCALSARSLVTNALHVPDFKYNLLSELCSGKVKEVSKEEGGLYLLMKHFTNKIDSSPGKEVAFTVNNTKAVDMELWHQRLGHVSSAVLARMFAMSQQILCKVTNCSFGKLVKILRSDNGTQFVNSVCISTFKEMGILLSSSVLKYETPYERLYGRQPVLTHLKTIGCLCFAKHLTEHEKLMPRVRSAVYMGYFEIQKGYILFDLGKRSFFVSRDVVFREDQFHFAQCPTIACPSRVPYDETELPLSNAIPGPEVAPDEVVSDSIPNGSRLVSESRRSFRHKQPPVWMKDFVSCPLNKVVPHSICNNISYDHLSSSYQSYIVATSIIKEPEPTLKL